MKKAYLISFFLLSGVISINAQVSSVAVETATGLIDEIETGSIQGRITTTDNQPAAYVNVSIKENNRTSFTDENGFFIFKNIPVLNGI